MYPIAAGSVLGDVTSLSGAFPFSTTGRRSTNDAMVQETAFEIY